MRIIGLTGGVAMGKSTVTTMLRQEGYRVFDADACVRRLYNHDRVFLAQLKKVFPQVFSDNEVDKTLLSNRVFADSTARKILESLIHPHVSIQANRFIQRGRRERCAAIFCDIPLLWSHGWDQVCDGVIVVYCHEKIQLKRIYQRGWDQERWQQIVNIQMPIIEQCRRADWVLGSHLGKAKMRRDLRHILGKILN